MIIAPDYLDAFKGYYGSEFVELVNFALQESGRSFFPTIGDLKAAEISQRSYNPYGGFGSLPYVEDMLIIQELTKMEKEIRDSRIKISELTKNIGEEMPKGESG